MMRDTDIKNPRIVAVKQIPHNGTYKEVHPSVESWCLEHNIKAELYRTGVPYNHYKIDDARERMMFMLRWN